MKQKLMSSIGGCLLLAFLLLACPIRGQAAEIKVIDDDNGVQVQYTLTAMEGEDAYSAKVSFADADAQPEELNIKSVVNGQDGTSYTIKEITSVLKNTTRSTLTKINIAEGITTVYDYALTEYNKDDIDVQFPSTLEKVTGTDGFVSWGEWPNSVIVPKWLSKMQPENGVVYAGKVAIYVPQAENDAEKVSEVTFKDGCTQITHKALFGNTEVTKVNIPASVKAIGGAAFSGCTNLSQVNFAADAQLEDLDWRAFYGCTALKSIKVPDSVTRIGTETFAACTSLSAIDISKQSKLTQIEYGAFGYYPYRIDLKSLGGFSPIQPRDTSKESLGVAVKKIYLPVAAIQSYNVGQTAAGLFAGCTTLEEVTIGSSGDSKTELLYEMFAGCTNLKTVHMDENVNTIETAAFAECTSLKSIDLKGVEEIKSYAFAKAGLSEVTIPSSVENIGAIAFGGCTSLETMTLESRLSKESQQLGTMLSI